MQSESQTELPPKVFETADAVGFLPASNSKRIMAFIIDAVIVAAIGTLIQGILESKTIGMSQTPASLVRSLLAVLYWVLLPLYYRGTIGKKVFGLRIVTADNSLNLGFGQILMREVVGKFVSMITLFVGYFWIFFHPEHKTFHDLMAKTKVVHYR